jgi:peptidyl-tRNA hydrolase, PTH1 family
VKLIVGLGNPGKQYELTRHNVGFRTVDVLAGRWRIGMSVEKFHAWFGSGMVGGEGAVLLKPTTFMNRSGQAVLAAGRFYQLELRDLLMISDDWALPLGRLRMRVRGSAGGHKGLQDAVDRLGTEEFCRLRIGIGEPVGPPTPYVLTAFSADEEEVIRPAIEQAADAVERWAAQGPEAAMNRYNG